MTRNNPHHRRIVPDGGQKQGKHRGFVASALLVIGLGATISACAGESSVAIVDSSAPTTSTVVPATSIPPAPASAVPSSDAPTGLGAARPSHSDLPKYAIDDATAVPTIMAERVSIDPRVLPFELGADFSGSQMFEWAEGYVIFRPFTGQKVNLWTSPDGLDWTRRKDITLPFIYDRWMGDAAHIAFVDDHGALAVSSDLENWEHIDNAELITRPNSGPGPQAGGYGWVLSFGSTLVSAAWGAEPVTHTFNSPHQEVAITNAGILVLEVSESRHQLWFSTDGLNWNRRTLPVGQISPDAGVDTLALVEDGVLLLLRATDRVFLADPTGAEWVEIDMGDIPTRLWNPRDSTRGLITIIDNDVNHDDAPPSLVATRDGITWLFIEELPVGNIGIAGFVDESVLIRADGDVLIFIPS